VFIAPEAKSSEEVLQGNEAVENVELIISLIKLPEKRKANKNEPGPVDAEGMTCSVILAETIDATIRGSHFSQINIKLIDNRHPDDCQ